MAFFPRSLRSAIIALIRIVVVVYSGVLMALLFFQENLIFHPSILKPDHRYVFERPFEEHRFTTAEDKADSLLFRAEAPKGTILYLHGNAGSLADWGFVASELAERTGWNVWIVDYPGYGRSEGRIRSESGLHAFAAEFVAFARSKLGSDEKLILYGRSIGSGLAVKLGSESQFAGLILESPYLSLQSLVRQIFPWAPTFLLKYKLRSDEWLPKVTCPVFIVHGRRDEIIPFAQGEQLSRLNPKVHFAPIAVAQHNNLSEFPEYWQELAGFLNGVVK